MDNKKRNKLKDKIRVAASLTPHQAGKVAGVVINMFSKEVDDLFVEDYIPRVYSPRGSKLKRKPEDCAKDCNGPMCDGCPDFIAIQKEEPKCTCCHVETTDVRKDGTKHYHTLCNGLIANCDGSPFELDEETPDAEEITIDVPVGSIILDPKEFELIKHTFKGAIKSTINDKVNVLRKYGDNPEQFEKAIEDIRIISKLISRLDKI